MSEPKYTPGTAVHIIDDSTLAYHGETVRTTYSVWAVPSASSGEPNYLYMVDLGTTYAAAVIDSLIPE